MMPANSPATRAMTASLLVVACLGLAVATFAVATADAPTRYSGRATGVSIHTSLLDTSFADTGDLPPQGGVVDATPVTVDASLAKAEVFLVITEGFDNVAQSEAVIVSHAHSDIRCGGVTPVPKDFVTGGGFISVTGGSANFGFVAGYKPGASTSSCHLTYFDHAAGIRIQMTDLSDWGGSATTRTFKGLATVNGASDRATITVMDGGEPGRGVDTFRISLASSDYVASGTLAGGNIQLHA